MPRWLQRPATAAHENTLDSLERDVNVWELGAKQLKTDRDRLYQDRLVMDARARETAQDALDQRHRGLGQELRGRMAALRDAMNRGELDQDQTRRLIDVGVKLPRPV